MHRFLPSSPSRRSASRPPLRKAAAPDRVPAQPQTRMADKAALAFIASDSVGDVQLANLALQRARSAAVRSFAQTMVADHTKSALQAMDLAKRVGASNAKLEPSDEILIAEQHLARYKGYEFEEEWLKHEITAHQSDIETLRDALEVASDAGVMQFELSTLQTDEKHLGLANAAFDEVERTTGRAKERSIRDGGRRRGRHGRPARRRPHRSRSRQPRALSRRAESLDRHRVDLRAAGSRRRRADLRRARRRAHASGRADAPRCSRPPATPSRTASGSAHRARRRC